jgi:DinB superfamily
MPDTKLPPTFVFTEGRDALAKAPEVYRSLLLGLDEATLHADEGPGTWTPYQVLCHVLHAETDDWMPRVRILLESGEHRTFTPFDREAGTAKYSGRRTADLVAEFARLRAASLRELDGLGLREADLPRTGRHPQLGTVTLGQLLSCWCTHDWAHVLQISRIVTRTFGAHVGPWRTVFSALNDPNQPGS